MITYPSEMLPVPNEDDEVEISFDHLGRRWRLVKIRDSWFARDDNDCDTGPFSTAADAYDWVLAIRP